MSRLTLRLPATLHGQLEDLAGEEGVSLNQFIVYALTRQVSQAYLVRTLPEKEAEIQKVRFAALLQGLGSASFSELESFFSEREQVSGDAGLTAELRERFAHKLKQNRTKAS